MEHCFWQFCSSVLMSSALLDEWHSRVKMPAGGDRRRSISFSSPYAIFFCCWFHDTTRNNNNDNNSNNNNLPVLSVLVIRKYRCRSAIQFGKEHFWIVLFLFYFPFSYLCNSSSHFPKFLPSHSPSLFPFLLAGYNTYAHCPDPTLTFTFQLSDFNNT